MSSLLKSDLLRERLVLAHEPSRKKLSEHGPSLARALLLSLLW